jgi:hypothetical protein
MNKTIKNNSSYASATKLNSGKNITQNMKYSNNNITPPKVVDYTTNSNSSIPKKNGPDFGNYKDCYLDDRLYKLVSLDNENLIINTINRLESVTEKFNSKFRIDSKFTIESVSQNIQNAYDKFKQCQSDDELTGLTPIYGTLNASKSIHVLSLTNGTGGRLLYRTIDANKLFFMWYNPHDSIYEFWGPNQNAVLNAIKFINNTIIVWSKWLNIPISTEVITQTNTDEVKSDEVKSKEIKTEEIKTDDVKTDEVKSDEVKTEEIVNNASKLEIDNSFDVDDSELKALNEKPIPDLFERTASPNSLSPLNNSRPSSRNRYDRFALYRSSSPTIINNCPSEIIEKEENTHLKPISRSATPVIKLIDSNNIVEEVEVIPEITVDLNKKVSSNISFASIISFASLTKPVSESVTESVNE